MPVARHPPGRRVAQFATQTPKEPGVPVGKLPVCLQLIFFWLTSLTISFNGTYRVSQVPDASLYTCYTF
ncbi:MAG: hypothetical protein ACYC49_12405 [Ignavibacteriaceae bacterium]